MAINNRLYASVGLCVGKDEPADQLGRTLAAFKDLADSYAIGAGEWYENGELITERNVHFRLTTQSIGHFMWLCQDLNQHCIGFTYICDGEDLGSPVYWHAVHRDGMVHFDTFHGKLNTEWV